jgi:hypothetical protein
MLPWLVAMAIKSVTCNGGTRIATGMASHGMRMSAMSQTALIFDFPSASDDAVVPPT